MNIEFYRGTSRWVVAIPLLGIALKFPRIQLISALYSLLNSAELAIRYNKLEILKKELADQVSFPKQYARSKWLLLAGIVANLNEFRYWKKTQNPFLWPTRFSFFGLCNIQPLASTKPTEDVFLKVRELLDKISDGEIWNDRHTFREGSNYSIDYDGHLRLLDYASLQSQDAITKYGEAFYSQSRSFFQKK